MLQVVLQDSSSKERIFDDWEIHNYLGKNIQIKATALSFMKPKAGTREPKGSHKQVC